MWVSCVNIVGAKCTGGSAKKLICVGWQDRIKCCRVTVEGLQAAFAVVWLARPSHLTARGAKGKGRSSGIVWKHVWNIVLQHGMVTYMLVVASVILVIEMFKEHGKRLR